MRTDLTYLLRFDDDVMPLAGNSTIGRHLDCDAVVAGEDVLDFHLRIEVDDRGPIAHPLQDATFTVNGTERDSALGLSVGDTLGVGSMTLQIGVEREGEPDTDEWWLYEEYGEEVRRIDGDLLVGRHGECDVVVPNDHVSRRHARLKVISGAVWVCDLDSANGTSINGMQVVGSRRLLHGDVVRFDEEGYQLVGRGGELTGVRRPTETDLTPLGEAEQLSEPSVPPAETTEFARDFAAPADVTAPQEGGAYLLGASDPVTGQTFRLPMGRSLLGREHHADVRLRDASVSGRHAELVVRPEGVTVTNLMATNGTFVNDEAVHVGALNDGDVLRVGRVQLVYRDVPHAQPGVMAINRASRWMIGGALALALVLGALLLS